MKRIVLQPARKGCPSISGTMKGVVSSMEGVGQVSVIYEDRALDIEYDDTIISPSVIVEHIGRAMGIAMKETHRTNLSDNGDNDSSTCM